MKSQDRANSQGTKIKFCFLGDALSWPFLDNIDLLKMKITVLKYIQQNGQILLLKIMGF